MNKKQTGYSLLEVIVSMLIIGAIITAVPCAIATANKTTVTNNKHTMVESLARSQMDHVQSQTYDKVNNPPVYSLMSNIPAGYSIDTQMAERLDPKGNGVATDDGLQKVTVTVKYLSQAEYIIVDYKINTNP
jgi:prepilin-type N-terminal cleavage/methylation domain-containing protein